MLITANEIREARQLSNAVPINTLNQYIEDAEIADLRPLLGEELYQDLTARPTATNKGDYPTLLNGGTYEYANYTYTFPGLKSVLIDFAYARYRYFGSDTDTAFGNVRKQYQDGVQNSDNRNREVYGAIRKVAFAKWSLCVDYLNRYTNGNQDFEYWYGAKKQIDNDQDSINMNTVTLD